MEPWLDFDTAIYQQLLDCNHARGTQGGGGLQGVHMRYAEPHKRHTQGPHLAAVCVTKVPPSVSLAGLIQGSHEAGVLHECMFAWKMQQVQQVQVPWQPRRARVRLDMVDCKGPGIWSC